MRRVTPRPRLPSGWRPTSTTHSGSSTIRTTAPRLRCTPGGRMTATCTSIAIPLWPTSRPVASSATTTTMTRRRSWSLTSTGSRSPPAKCSSSWPRPSPATTPSAPIPSPWRRSGRSRPVTISSTTTTTAPPTAAMMTVRRSVKGMRTPMGLTMRRRPTAAPIRSIPSASL